MASAQGAARQQRARSVFSKGLSVRQSSARAQAKGSVMKRARRARSVGLLTHDAPDDAPLVS